MDTLNLYRKVIEDTLEEYASVPYAYGEIQTEPVFDRRRQRRLDEEEQGPRLARPCGVARPQPLLGIPGRRYGGLRPSWQVPRSGEARLRDRRGRLCAALEPAGRE